MKVCLSYRELERATDEKYYDTDSIISDLGLKTLFLSAAKRLIFEDGKLKSVEKEDPYLMETLRNVMMIPLTSEDDIKFRQDVVKDFLEHEDLIRSI